MNKIITHTDSESLFIPQKKGKRGAKVYGLPMSRELASYIDDVSPDAQRQRLFSMFFAGKFSPVNVVEESDGFDGDF
ncbi:MAG: hypothetical protein MJ052_03445 [Sphaerochaetaceae bacterium]|nr:hypothetical protein [Sphaerochaetaceae bacterium]